MGTSDTLLAAACAGDERAFRSLIEPHRRELKAHCYRMAGSLHDAEDLLQESLLKAWRSIGAFEGRSSLRTWLYRVTTTACLDALASRSARVLPASLGPAVSASEAHGPADSDSDIPWLEPCPSDLYGDSSSPEAQLSAKQSVSLAFLVALQKLSPKQRAVLILRDVLGYRAEECAEMLDGSVASVNSALQRAREAVGSDDEPPAQPADTSMLQRYMRAWEQADVSSLVALLREDATLMMPPLSYWLQGTRDIAASLTAMVLPPQARGVFRLVPIEANGLPAMAAYRRDDATSTYLPFAIQVLQPSPDGIAAITAFLDPSLFALFGLPPTA
jgi:RNA polymerase sigma-70 factor, ECF subfamily